MKNKIPRIITVSILTIALIFTLCSCSLKKNSTDSVDTEALSLSIKTPEFDSDDNENNIDISNAAVITFSGNAATVTGSGASVSGGTVTIKSGGVYAVTGTASDGMLIIDASDTATVKIVLNNADILSKSSSAIYVKNAKKVILNAATGTVNTLTDGSTYSGQNEDGEPDSTVYSKSDLTINGNGTLNVNGNLNDAVKCKDTLKITSLTLNIKSVDDGIIGKDFAVIKDGNINITADGDGIKSTYDTDTTKGEICISGGTFNITAGADGLQATTEILISGGDLSITTGGGPANAKAHTSSDQMGGGFGKGMNTTAETTTQSTATEDSGSFKGIKSAYLIEISGGTFNVSSADDTIHSNNTITVSGGTFSLASGDDAMHADTTLNINGGDINITQCYEGIEAATINYNGGSTSLKASDDGFNASGGTDNSQSSGPMGGDRFNSSSTALLNITGGYILVDAGGDGLDSNGSITMSGGTVIINGPTNDGDGALDYDSTFVMTGGTLIAAGFSGMAQSISDSSSVYAVSIGVSSLNNKVVKITDSDGKEIVSFMPAKTFSNVVYVSPLLESGKTYTVSTADYVSGDNTNGVITGGSFSYQTEIGTFTASAICSTVGTSSGTMGAGGGKFGGNRQNGEKQSMPADASGAAGSAGDTPPNGGQMPSGEQPSMPSGGVGGIPPEGSPGAAQQSS